jgi:hypothetical protein
MIGELQTRQILALVKDGMPIEQIAHSLDIDPALIKLAVARNSQDGDRDITDEDLARLRAHAVSLALNADNEAVQAKMTMYLIDRDKPKNSNVTINPILMVNQAIKEAHASFHDLVKEYTDVPS